MVATTLLDGADKAPDVGEHPGHSEEEDEFLHPWAREMYRRGFSFNGGERTKLFLSAGGSLVDVSDVSNADSPLDGRALLVCDLDDDGDEDLFVHNIQRERHHLYRSDVNPDGGFLSIQLEAARGEAIGALVRVRPLAEDAPTAAQVMSRGAGYSSCQAPQLVFGLGAAPRARVEVRWPWGELENFGEIPSGARVVLRQGSGEPRPRARVGSFSLADPLPPGLKLSRGERIPPLALVDADGKSVIVDPAELTADGTVTLEIWASYCRPCVKKLPELVERHRGGERIIALSVDIPKERARASRLLANHGADFPSLFVSAEDGPAGEGFDRTFDLMRLPIPTEVVIGPGGVLREVRRPTDPR